MDDAPLPTEQYRYEGLPVLTAKQLHERRERIFLVLSGFFLGTLAMLNILGVTRFVDLSFRVPLLGWEVPMPLAIGVLPYPITFLCTDFISELYGRRRANAVVWLGFALNCWVAFILWLGGVLPGFGPSDEAGTGVFFEVRRLAFSAVSASMVAYLLAQLVDVQLFHFWRRVTGGRYLWLRNNGSTLVSQLIDTTAVIVITHYAAGGLPIDGSEALWPQLVTFIAAGYTFKVVTALADTLPFYLGARRLSRYLRIVPPELAHRHAAAGAVEASVG